MMDVKISAQLASELLEALDFARHHAASHGNDEAIMQLASMRLYLAHEIDTALAEMGATRLSGAPWTRSD